MQPIVNPLNLVIISAIPFQSFCIRPPTINPIPAPISPVTTKNHTRTGKSKDAASSALNGSLLTPYCKNTIDKGTRINQSTLSNLNIKTNLALYHYVI